MEKILMIKELIALLLECNMDALAYVNASGVPVGITKSNICWGGGGDGATVKEAPEVIFDITDTDKER